MLQATLVSWTSADDWLQWRGPDRTGVSKETDWSVKWSSTGPKVLWSAEVGTGFSSVVVKGERVITMGNRENVDSVVCLNSKDGSISWTHTYDSPLDDRFFEGGPTSTPLIDGDCVYALGRQGDLNCLRLATGEVIWSKNIATETEASVPGWGFASSPIVHNDWLILGVGEAGTVVDKKSGDVLWTSGGGEAGYMTPLPINLDGQTSLLVASGKAYQLVDLATGQLRWKHRWLTTYGCNAADPIVDGSTVFVSSGYNRGASLLQIDDQNAKVVWANKEMQNQMNGSIKLGSHLYGFSGNENGPCNIKCIDMSTGAVAWQSPELPLGSVAAAGQRLIVLSGSGELIIVPASPQGFQPIARAQIIEGKCWTVPVLSHGQLYVRNAEGKLVCIQLSHSN